MNNHDLQQLVEFMARSLVGDPSQVKVAQVEGDTVTIFELSVAQEDIGRVIGKSGKTANAMRVLLRAASGRQWKCVHLEIIS
jgi:predicted RNA-binding protein YlqC (UPF0109 family)